MKEQIEDGQQVALPIVESIGDKPYLTPIEAAKLLGVGKTTIYRILCSKCKLFRQFIFFIKKMLDKYKKVC